MVDREPPVLPSPGDHTATLSGSRHGDAATVEVRGVVGSGTTATLVATLRGLVAAGALDLTVDLSRAAGAPADLADLDAALVPVRGDLRDRGGWLGLTEPGPGDRGASPGPRPDDVAP